MCRGFGLFLRFGFVIHKRWFLHTFSFCWFRVGLGGFLVLRVRHKKRSKRISVVLGFSVFFCFSPYVVNRPGDGRLHGIHVRIRTPVGFDQHGTHRKGVPVGWRSASRFIRRPCFVFMVLADVIVHHGSHHGLGNPHRNNLFFAIFGFFEQGLQVPRERLPWMKLGFGQRRIKLFAQGLVVL